MISVLASWVYAGAAQAQVLTPEQDPTEVQAPTGVNYKSSRNNILVLISTHKTDTWSDAISGGVEEEIAASTQTIGIWAEYMDANRFTTSNSKRILASLYRRKYAGLTFDVIVTIGEPAVKFALAHHQDLFQDMPIIFSGLNTSQADEALAAGAITGVSEKFSYQKTLDAAFRLLPATRKIIFISPDLKNREAADSLIPTYRPEIELEIWHDADLADILQRAAKVGPDSILLHLADPGRSPQYSKPRDRFIAALTAISPAPVFSVWDVALGTGILGGYLTPGHDQGVIAGRFALDLVEGKSLSGVAPVEVKANHLTVDREALKHFAIEASSLPSDVQFHPMEAKPLRWLRQYFKQIAAVFFFFAAIAGVLLYLLFSRQKAQAARAESEARFRAVFEHMPMSMTLRDLQGRFMLVNSTFAKRYNVTADSMRGQSGLQVFGAELEAVLSEQNREVIHRDCSVEREHTLNILESGQELTILAVKFPVRDAQGQIVAIGTCSLDTSERYRAMEALVKSELRFQSLYDNAPDIYFTLGQSAKIDAVNKYGAHYLGYDKIDLEDASLLDLIHPNDQVEVNDYLARLKQGPTPSIDSNIEFRLVRNDSTYIWVNMRVHVVNDVLDKDPALWAICRDISAAHKLSEELSYQASHDSLTGLVNRREFEQRLMRCVEFLQDNQAQHVLCYLDLDQFKVINDTSGHLAGDELLRQLGKVFKRRLRTRDVVARLGGDEFAILMEHCPIQQASIIAEQIRADVEEHRFNWQQQVFSFSVSIGVAPIDFQSGSAEDILKAADSACYFAKEQGRNRVHIYTRDSIEVARYEGEVRWVARLKQALAEDRFELWYQPIVPVSKAEVSAGLPYFEFYLRMCNPDNTMVTASMFNSSAERFGLCSKIDRWVLSHAFSWLADNPEWKDSYSTCFINLSTTSIADESFLDFVFEQLLQFDISGQHICFDITETTVISNYVQVANFISALKPRGCRFALDDVGSGLSSFTHLKRLDVDFLKIDGQIVRNIATDSVDLAMVQSIQHIGSSMNKMTIAESIEDQQVLDILSELGVDFGQGFYTGAPTPLENLVSKPKAIENVPSQKNGKGS